ncbi:hypothetical protein C8J56DRAFT_897715 [Mycena floridula]|nr:hypothetical protein C8J56DRAFT_897715 [Mycena floridula]
MVDPNHPHWRISKLRLLKEYARAIWDGREAKQKGRVNPIEARFDCPSGGFGQLFLHFLLLKEFKIMTFQSATSFLFPISVRASAPPIDGWIIFLYPFLPIDGRPTSSFHLPTMSSDQSSKLLITYIMVKKYHIGREIGYLGEIDKLTWTEIDGYGHTSGKQISGVVFF